MADQVAHPVLVGRVQDHVSVVPRGFRLPVRCGRVELAQQVAGVPTELGRGLVPDQRQGAFLHHREDLRVGTFAGGFDELGHMPGGHDPGAERLPQPGQCPGHSGRDPHPPRHRPGRFPQRHRELAVRDRDIRPRRQLGHACGEPGFGPGGHPLARLQEHRQLVITQTGHVDLVQQHRQPWPGGFVRQLDQDLPVHTRLPRHHMHTLRHLRSISDQHHARDTRSRHRHYSVAPQRISTGWLSRVRSPRRCRCDSSRHRPAIWQ